MKRKMAVACLLAMMPLPAFAKTVLPDKDLVDVTGQAGVSINMDVTFNLHMDSSAWGDADGLGAGSGTTSGWIGWKNFDAKNVTAKFIPDPVTSQPVLMSIDIATEGATNPDGYGAGTSFVRVGTGSLELSMDSLDFDAALGNKDTLVPEETLGSVYLGNLLMDFNSASRIDIYSTTPQANGSGVVLNFDVTVDKLKMAALSWGNAGSLWGTTTTGGYFGLSGVNVNKLHIVGPVTFNVATVTPGTTDPMMAIYSQVMGPNTTFVRVGLGTGDSSSGSTISGTSFTPGAFGISMASFAGDLKVADNKQLVGGQTMGSFLLSNVMFGVNGWVDIMAH